MRLRRGSSPTDNNGDLGTDSLQTYIIWSTAH